MGAPGVRKGHGTESKLKLYANLFHFSEQAPTSNSRVRGQYWGLSVLTKDHRYKARRIKCGYSDISLLLALVKMDIRVMKFKAKKVYNQFNVPGSSEQAAEVLRE